MIIKGVLLLILNVTAFHGIENKQRLHLTLSLMPKNFRAGNFKSIHIEIMVGPKGPSSWPTWLGLESPDS